MKDTGTRIRSVSRASALLLLVARSPEGVGPTRAAAHIGTAVPTAHHLLSTLEHAGLLSRDSRRRFVLGPAAGAVADAWLGAASPPEFLLAPLRALVEETGETVYLTAWRHDRISVLASLQGVGAIRVAEAATGPYRLPHARATGKLLLAFAGERRRAAALGTGPLERVTDATITDRAALDAELAAIRERGWAEDREEFARGVACVSAPAHSGGAVIAAYTVSAPAQLYADRREALRAAVLRAAAGAAGAAGAAAAPDTRPTASEVA